MGQVLNAPVTTKDTGDGRAPEKGIYWGYSAHQGWRVSMEDAHLALPELPNQDWKHVALFGVMDGHGGEHVAHFCEKHLPVEITKGPSQDACAALVSAFHKMDEMLADPENLQELRSCGNRGFASRVKTSQVYPENVGCTACICCVDAESIIVANCGDSRAVLCRNGLAVPLSEDHKPNCPRERQRIANAGGTVERRAYGSVVQYRVNGNLNLSRSIGDLEYKQNRNLQPDEQMICATPDVQVFARETGDQFFVIACDGVWDVMGSQDAVDFIRERIPQGNQSDNSPPDPKVLASIMEELLDQCVSPDLTKTSGLGGDNMTAVVVWLDRAQGSRQPADFGQLPKREQSVQEATLLPNLQLEQAALVDDKSIVPKGLLCGWQN